MWMQMNMACIESEQGLLAVDWHKKILQPILTLFGKQVRNDF
jgi:hypothetical protein